MLWDRQCQTCRQACRAAGKSCVNCAYYVRHYIRLHGRFFVPIELGHCTFPRVKPRKSRDLCGCWKPRKEGAKDARD
nr:MAG TPA: NADH-ubiquinone oxidoreductase subunit b14.5b (NDUFC2) [Caudoviricetes sp.]